MKSEFKYENAAKGLMVTQNTEVTPEDLAEMFWELTENQQALFFSRFLDITSKHEFELQMQAVSKSTHLYENGLLAMRIIGESIEP